MNDIEVINRLYDASADALWKALNRALTDFTDVKVKEVDEPQRRVTFSTSSSLTSWGEDMVAMVESAEPYGATLKVNGHARFKLLTTKWGEEMHQHQFVQRLGDAIRINLVRV